MNEFEIVLVQMPYVGGAASRMSDFFMRLTGFMAIGRVLRRHGVALPVIGDIERETYRAQLLTVPEAERLASGRQFMSADNRAVLREQAAKSHAEEYKEDSVYEFVEPGPGDRFEFGINYKACGFCKFAGRYGDQEILPHICRLDFDAYATRGIRLVGGRREPLQFPLLADRAGVRHFGILQRVKSCRVSKDRASSAPSRRPDNRVAVRSSALGPRPYTPTSVWL